RSVVVRSRRLPLSLQHLVLLPQHLDEPQRVIYLGRQLAKLLGLSPGQLAAVDGAPKIVDVLAELTKIHQLLGARIPRHGGPPLYAVRHVPHDVGHAVEPRVPVTDTLKVAHAAGHGLTAFGRT